MIDARAAARPIRHRPGIRAATLTLALMAGLMPGAAMAGTPESSPRDLSNAGGTLVFSASGTSGREPWRSNGTESGTQQLKDIRPILGSDPRDLVSLDGRVYFHAEGPTGRELWRTNGTPGGTVIVKDLGGASDGAVDDLVRAKTRLYFLGQKTNTGRELFRSDGTGAGTRLVKDIGPEGESGPVPGTLVAWGTKALFLADDGTGVELWRSDGTASGTRRVKNLTTTGDSLITHITPAGDRFFFVREASAGIFSLWRSDGRATATKKVAVLPGQPLELEALGRNVLIKQMDGAIVQLWRSNGTAAGTVALTSACAGDSGVAPEELTTFKGRVYFRGFGPTDCGDMELWRSDGTIAGTKRFKSLNATGRGDPGEFRVTGDRLYFSGNDGSTGQEPWRSDGTKAGTIRVADVDPGPGGSNPSEFRRVGSTVFFAAADDGGQELWKLTGGGATQVKDIAP